MSVPSLIQQYDTNSVAVKTNELGANETNTFAVDENEPEVSSTNFTPSNAELPNRGRIVVLRVNVTSGTSDTDIKIYQDKTATPINEVIQVTGAGVADTPESFVFGGGLGTSFVNKEGENQLYIQTDETSGAASKYEFEIHWYNLN